MSCDLPTEVSLGEPLVLACFITNGASEEISVDFGWRRFNNFDVQLVEPGRDGSRRLLPAEEVSGISPRHEVIVPPGGHYEHHVILTRWFQWRKPGLHQFTVRFNGSVKTSSGAQDIRRDYQFQIVVRPRDAARLEEIARALLKQARTAPMARDRLEAREKLVFVRDPIAVPYLYDLALYNIEPVDAIRALETIADARIPPLLKKLASHQDQEVSSEARRALARLAARK